MTADNKTPRSAESTANDRFAAAKAARAAAVARQADRREGAERERDDDLGGPKLKLSVGGTIEGHHLYWANDENAAIEDLLMEGFDFVATDEVSRGSDLVSDLDLSNRISRYVGERSDGSALRAYLMKCPQDIWDRRKEREQRQVNSWESEIREGRMQPQKGSGNYTPKGYESRLDTNSKV